MSQLHDYQKQGARFLCKRPRAILGDDPGLGKTVQALAAARKLQTKRVLVVCPASLKWVWHDECTKFKISTSADIEVYDRKLIKGDRWLTIINYEAMALERNHKVLSAIKWDVVVLDEAHRIKNRKAMATKAIKRIKSPRKWLLTANPILNSPDEVWSLLNYLYPDEYSSYWRFVNRYAEVWMAPWGRQISGWRDLEVLAAELAGIMLRRRKEDILKELPAKVYQSMIVEMLPQQAKLYDKMVKEFLVELGGDEYVSAPTVLAQLVRLKQIATYPALISPSLAEVPSAKMEGLLELLRQLLADEDGRVVVFAQQSETVEHVTGLLDKHKYTYVKLTGKIPDKYRKGLVQKFQDGRVQVFIATVGVGSFGLTLTKAHSAIFIDKTWTPAYNEQAEDRIYGRMNDPHGATIYSILTKGTVEEAVEKMLLDKQQLVSKVMSGDTSILRGGD